MDVVLWMTNVVVVLGESACTYFIEVVSQMKMDPFAEPAATYRASGLKHTRVLSDPEKYSGCLYQKKHKQQQGERRGT